MRRALVVAALVLTAARVNAQEQPRALFPWLQLFQLGGAATSYREDAAHVSGHFGNFVLAVRNDAGGSLCGTTGDYCPFQLDASGQVRVLAAQAGAPWSVSGSGTFTVAGTITQGNAGSHAQRWMVGLSDGSGFISPATDRTTAGGPFSVRLSDGSAFYNAPTSAQLPGALDGSGFLKVHEQGTATVSGTVTANAGTNLNTSSLALDATLTGRLPAGASPADNESNTNTSLSRAGVFNFVYDGTTWDRWPGDSINGGKQNQTAINGVAVSVSNGAVDTGTQRVTLAQRVTYAASTTAKTATAAGTGPFFTICGSASKTIRIQQFIVSGTVATAAVWGDVVLKKTSAATSAGTATALTKVPLDSNSAAGTANAVNYYTVLATAGTLVGAIASQTELFPVTGISATLQPNPAPIEFKWRDQDSESPVLRGTAQCMEANFGTTTTNAPTLTVSVKWTEE
jgi:hypothetical protein